VTTSPPTERFRGVNNRLAPDQLEPGLVAHAENYRMRTGECVPRLGVIKPGWLNYTDSQADDVIHPVGQFFGVCVFKDPNGVEWVIECSDGFVYRCRPHNERFALTMPTGVRILGPCYPVQAFNKVWLFRGRYLAPLVIQDLDTGVEDIVTVWTTAGVFAASAETAYGPFQAVTTLTSVASLATVATTLEHGYITGADVTILGAVQTEYNGRFNITVVDAYTFTYNFAGSATTPATGTIVASNMSRYWRAHSTLHTLAVGELTRVTTTATVAWTAHGFAVGQRLLVAGAAQSEYNGETVIATVPDANSFTYTVANSGATPATGTITISDIPQAGQSPDLYPTKWTRIYNILPNADDALYINNRLLVPTAYTPSDDTASPGYDSTSSYTKKDFVVATDILDDLHFDFVNEFRINQGSADQIVLLIKYNQDTVIVLKETTWGILSNIRIDLANVTLDMRDDGYGACARAGVLVGKDVIFPADKRGLVSLKQNELGRINGTDIPFSDDVEGYVKRINWNLAAQQRLGYHDDKLYWAVALDGGELACALAASEGAAGSMYFTLVAGLGYIWAGASTDATLLNGAETLTGSGRFTAQTDFAQAHGDDFGEVRRFCTGVNNALLVYDFRLAAWQGLDTSEAFTVLEFFKPAYNNLRRLAYLASDGWCNLLEEAHEDQVQNDALDTAPQGLGWTPLLTNVLSRGHTEAPASKEGPQRPTDAPKRFKRLDTVLAVWDARFTLTANTGAAFQEQAVRTNVEFSRTKYLKPFDKPPYVQGNVNEDHATRGRGNYSVPLDAGAGVTLGEDGINPEMAQEITVRASVRTLAHRYIQFRVTSDQGRCTVQALGAEASAGQKRDNIII
jgi:hypothetical protein